MTPANLASVIDDDVRARLEEAVRDLKDYCEKRGEPLTQAQMFAVMSLPLRISLGFQEAMENVVETYDAIRQVMPELPDWPSDEGLAAWLREGDTEGRMH